MEWTTSWAIVIQALFIAGTIMAIFPRPLSFRLASFVFLWQVGTVKTPVVQDTLIMIMLFLVADLLYVLIKHILKPNRRVK